MSALDDINAELQARSPQPEDGEDKFTLIQEFVLIFSRIVYIFTVAFLIYYIPAYLITIFLGGDREFMLEKILIWSFAIGALTGVLLTGRGTGASAIFMASTIRSAWTGRRMEAGAFAFYRDFAFGIKLDTIMFYGSLFVFALTYFIK